MLQSPDRLLKVKTDQTSAEEWLPEPDDVKLPANEAGLPGKEIPFILCPLTPPTRRGLRGTLRPKFPFNMQYIGLKSMSSLISILYDSAPIAYLNKFVDKKIIFTISFFLLTKDVSLILIDSIPKTYTQFTR